MDYILDFPSQEIFLDTIIEQTDSADIHINELAQECPYYTFNIYGNSYFLSKTILTKQKNGVNISTYIDDVFEISESTSFSLNDINDDLIEFMLKNHTSSPSSLTDNIFEIYQSYLQRYD